MYGTRGGARSASQKYAAHSIAACSQADQARLGCWSSRTTGATEGAPYHARAEHPPHAGTAGEQVHSGLPFPEVGRVQGGGLGERCIG